MDGSVCLTHKVLCKQNNNLHAKCALYYRKTLNTPQQPSTLVLGRKQSRIFVSKFQWTGNTKIIWMKAAAQQTMDHGLLVTFDKWESKWTSSWIPTYRCSWLIFTFGAVWRCCDVMSDTRDTDGGAGPGGQRARVTQMSRCHVKRGWWPEHWSHCATLDAAADTQ